MSTLVMVPWVMLYEKSVEVQMIHDHPICYRSTGINFEMPVECFFLQPSGPKIFQSLGLLLNGEGFNHGCRGESGFKKKTSISSSVFIPDFEKMPKESGISMASDE